MKRKLVFVMGFLVLFLVFTTNSMTNVHAATRPTLSSLSDFSNLQKTCRVIYVELHKTQSPTMTCAQTKVGSVVSPKTEVRPCTVPGVTLEVYTTNSSICFIQTGYWAYRINNVVEVTSNENAWFLWYTPGSTQGNFCNLNYYNSYFVDNFDMVPTVAITQIDPGVNNSHDGPDWCGSQQAGP